MKNEEGRKLDIQYLQNNIESIFDRVEQSDEPVFVNLEHSDNLVLIKAKEFCGWLESVRNMANAINEIKKTR